MGFYLVIFMPSEWAYHPVTRTIYYGKPSTWGIGGNDDDPVPVRLPCYLFRLYKAFDTSTDLPAARVNLVKGIDIDDEEVPTSISVAEAGSWIMGEELGRFDGDWFFAEFGTLSLLTGDWKYYEAARKALDHLWYGLYTRNIVRFMLGLGI